MPPVFEYVQITLVDGTTTTVRATSYGDAASQVFCGNGRIREFRWVGGPQQPQQESEATIGN